MDEIVTAIHKRTVMSVAYTIVLQTAQVLLLSLSGVDIFHPISWISGTIYKLTLFTVWAHYIILCALLTALNGSFKTKILNGPFYFSNRFNILRDLFRLSSLFQASLHVVIGIVMSCFYLILLEGKYSSLYKPCLHNNGFCVVEGKIFIVCCAAWCGIYVFLMEFFKSSYCVIFPVIQQLSFLRLKAELLPSFKQCMVKSLLPCLIFPLLYFLYGGIILQVVCDIFDLTVEDKILNSFVDIFNFPLIFYSWLIATLYMFTVRMMTHILNILLTNLCEYPVTRQFGEKDIVTLHEVVAAHGYPIIQNWGCFDLCNLAKSDYCRRQEIFALSQPGGHPNNWNAIKKECLYLMDKFVEDVNLGVAQIIAAYQADAGIIPIAAATPTPLQRRITRQMTLASAGSSVSSGASGATATSGRRTTRDSAVTMRNLSIISSDPLSGYYESFYEESVPSEPKLLDYLRHSVSSAVPYILRKTRLQYFFEKFPDSKLKLTFSNSMPVINAVQGLSFLVAASLTEDEYGVVQKDLNTIMLAILQLKVAVDKALKFGNFKRAPKSEQHDVQMKAALKSALKRSLYKICVTFKDHIHELDLPPTVVNQLQVYLTFRE